MTKKTPGWEGRLVTYLRSVAAQPFKPSQRDCAMFFADCVLAMTGVDYGAEFRGKYRSIAAGKKMLADKGFADHVVYAESLFPAHPSVLFAHRGDGAVVRDDQGNEALGIVQGEYVYVMTLAGLGLVPLTQAFKAFQI